MDAICLQSAKKTFFCFFDYQFRLLLLVKLITWKLGTNNWNVVLDF